MTEIICVHAPRLVAGNNVKVTDGVVSTVEVMIRICNRCNTSWNEGTQPPRVVIAKIEELEDPA